MLAMDDAVADLRAALDEVRRVPSDEQRTAHARQTVGVLLAAGSTMDQIACDAQASINDLFALLGGSARPVDGSPDWHVS